MSTPHNLSDRPGPNALHYAAEDGSDSGSRLSAFNARFGPPGLTFDDVMLLPAASDVLPQNHHKIKKQ